jgi:hypothetical protein
MPKGLRGAGEKFSSRVPGGSREEVKVFFDDDRGGVVVVLAPVMVIKEGGKNIVSDHHLHSGRLYVDDNTYRLRVFKFKLWRPAAAERISSSSMTRSSLAVSSSRAVFLFVLRLRVDMVVLFTDSCCNARRVSMY